jgi:type IV pilus assembly protein PilX
MLRESKLILGNQSGVALVVALLMIVILSLIGIASSSNSTFEIRLSGNKRGSTDAFYAANGGSKSVLPIIANFNTSSGYVAVTQSALPTELQTESIDLGTTAPTLDLPGGVSFTSPPQVTIYHTTVAKVPRGLGLSAIAFQYNYYIIDSVGQDQMDLSLIRSNCEIREKIVRLIPTGS